MTPTVRLTHTLFVNDVLIFGLGNENEWMVINEIRKLYCESLVFNHPPKVFLIKECCLSRFGI